EAPDQPSRGFPHLPSPRTDHDPLAIQGPAAETWKGASVATRFEALDVPGRRGASPALQVGAGVPPRRGAEMSESASGRSAPSAPSVPAPAAAPPFPLSTLRHSVAHLMASAVGQLFPGARYGNGPAIDHGFFYDFELPRKLEDSDLERIEQEMRRIAKS